MSDGILLSVLIATHLVMLATGYGFGWYRARRDAKRNQKITATLLEHKAPRRTIQCCTCNGSGMVNQTKNLCPTCNGRGYVLLSDNAVAK